MAEIRRKRTTRSQRRRVGDAPARRLPDAEALELLKASGILNSNVTLDQIMKLSEQLKVSVALRGFIFRDFIFRPC